MRIKSLILIAALAPLSACGAYDNRNIESPPNTITTADGPIVCQHYIDSWVLFDRAWVKPVSMASADANTACQAEGRRLAAGGERRNLNLASGFASQPTR